MGATWKPVKILNLTAQCAAKIVRQCAMTMMTHRCIAKPRRLTATWGSCRYCSIFFVYLFLGRRYWSYWLILCVFHGSAVGRVASRSSRCAIFWFLCPAFFAVFLRCVRRGVLRMWRKVINWELNQERKIPEKSRNQNKRNTTNC